MSRAIANKGTPGYQSEVDIIHNPALGAYLLWRVGAEYEETQGESIPFLLCFLVLPLLLHRPTLEVINSTNKPSGLTLFASKLGEGSESLLAIHSRALVLRDLTLKSMTMGVRSRMLIVNYGAATVYSLDLDSPPTIPERIKPMTRGAERIGAWFSKLPIGQIASLLRVNF